MAATNGGVIYAIDIANDLLGTINKTTGNWTFVSALPFNANFAQDMATDRENDMLYYAAYSYDYGGQLWTIDPLTDQMTLIDAFEGSMEVTSLIIPTEAPAHRWLTLSAYEGTLSGPFGSESVKVYYNSSGLSQGDYYANIHVYSLLSGTTTVPVHMSVGSPAILVEPTTLTVNPTNNLVPPPVASPESGSAGYGELKSLNIKPQDNRHDKKDFVPGKLLVKFRKNVTVDERGVSTNSADINSLFRNLNVRAIKRVFEDNGIRTAEKDAAGLFSIYLVKCPESADMKQAVRLFQSLPDVIYAEPDYLAYADYVPPDGMYPDQWGLNNTGQAQHNPDLVPVGTLGADIGAQQAWDIETGNASTVVAVLDEGVDLTHPEFAGRLLPGYDFFNNDNDPSPFDDDAHGTACTGIIAAAMNGTGIVGVAWNVNILPVKVMELGSGPYDVIAQGVVWSADQLADILSMSLGGSGYSATLEAAVNYAYTSGCVIVAAAGNSNVNNGMTPHYPCSFTNVISVGAMSPCNDRKTPSTCDGETWWGSNYGGGLDFVAPGVRIPTTDIMGAAGYTTGDYTPFFNGTSSACPQ
jgi:subtilisin family serine protease